MVSYVSERVPALAGAAHFAEVEAADPRQVAALQEERLRRQYAYLWQHSAFYRRKFAQAGLDPQSVRSASDLVKVPFTTKQELRDSLQSVPPFGEHLAAPVGAVIQMQASSGTTGSPSYVALTQHDAYVWQESSARSLYACGIRPGDLVLHGFSMSKGFVGGLPIFQAIQYMGAVDIPIGADGGVDRLLAAAFDLKPAAIVGTPNFLAHLAETALATRGRSVRDIGVRRLVVGGEPGGGIPAVRERLQDLWHAKSCELMGGTDLAVIYWAECDEQDGMHMTAPDFILAELIDPDTGQVLPMRDGTKGELVYTALDREASPVFRFRSGDHVVVTGTACRCGRTQPKIRCFGRTDDMLIVRGVNLFPSAVQDIVESLRPRAAGIMRILADFDGHSTQDNLKVLVERGAQAAPGDDDVLRETVALRIRNALSVKADVRIVPCESFERPGATKVKLVLREAPVGLEERR